MKGVEMRGELLALQEAKEDMERVAAKTNGLGWKKGGDDDGIALNVRICMHTEEVGKALSYWELALRHKNSVCGKSLTVLSQTQKNGKKLTKRKRPTIRPETKHPRKRQVRLNICGALRTG